MKLIFNSFGTLWIISNSGAHPDVDGCTSVIATQTFNPIKTEAVVNDVNVITYKTLDETKTELQIS